MFVCLGAFRGCFRGKPSATIIDTEHLDDKGTVTSLYKQSFANVYL